MPIKLQEMIDLVLRGTQDQALAKLAQEAEGEGEGEELSDEEKKRRAEMQAKKEESQQGGGQAESGETSDERVEKLSAAVEEIVHLLTRGRGGRVVLAQDATQLPTDENRSWPMEGEVDLGQAKETIPLIMPTESVYAEPATAVETDEDDPEVGQQKVSSLQKQALRRLMQKRASLGLTKRKMAGEDTSPATISAPKTSVLPEDRPVVEALEAGSEQLRSLLSSNESVMGLTKRKAKELPREQLKAYLDEPALSRTTDKALDQTLGTELVDQAGAKIASSSTKKLKIAAARALISKIASEGCTCSSDGLKTGECRFCKVSSRIKGSKCAENDSFDFGPPAGNSPQQAM